MIGADSNNVSHISRKLAYLHA